MSDNENTTHIAVLTERFENFRAEIFDRLDLILEQTTRTNGRVTTLEEQIAEARGKFKILAWLGGIFSAIITGLTIKNF